MCRPRTRLPLRCKQVQATSRSRLSLTSCRLIFVHGLFGHPYKTWTSAPSKGKKRSTSPQGATRSSQSPRPSGESHDALPADGSIYWPQALLPKVIPDVRIYTWGYDAVRRSRYSRYSPAGRDGRRAFEQMIRNNVAIALSAQRHRL